MYEVGCLAQEIIKPIRAFARDPVRACVSNVGKYRWKRSYQKQLRGSLK